MTARVSLFLLLFAASRTLNAQSTVAPPKGLTIAAFAGGAAFTDFQRAGNRHIGAKTSVSFAAAVSYWPSRNWGLRAKASYSPSQFESFITPANSAASHSDATWASLGIMSYEGQALFRMPTIRRRVMPYGIVGAGVVRYTVDQGDGTIPPEAQPDFEGKSPVLPGVNFGLGAMLGMRPGWSMSFELAHRISKTPVSSETPGAVRWTSSAGFMVGLGLKL